MTHTHATHTQHSHHPHQQQAAYMRTHTRRSDHAKYFITLPTATICWGCKQKLERTGTPWAHRNVCSPQHVYDGQPGPLAFLGGIQGTHQHADPWRQSALQRITTLIGAESHAKVGPCNGRYGDQTTTRNVPSTSSGASSNSSPSKQAHHLADSQGAHNLVQGEPDTDSNLGTSIKGNKHSLR
jgi:hypothetical protein